MYVQIKLNLPDVMKIIHILIQINVSIKFYLSKFILKLNELPFRLEKYNKCLEKYKPTILFCLCPE